MSQLCVLKTGFYITCLIVWTGDRTAADFTGFGKGFLQNWSESGECYFQCFSWRLCLKFIIVVSSKCFCFENSKTKILFQQGHSDFCCCRVTSRNIFDGISKFILSFAGVFQSWHAWQAGRHKRTEVNWMGNTTADSVKRLLGSQKLPKN